MEEAFYTKDEIKEALQDIGFCKETTENLLGTLSSDDGFEFEGTEYTYEGIVFCFGTMCNPMWMRAIRDELEKAPAKRKAVESDKQYIKINGDQEEIQNG